MTKRYTVTVTDVQASWLEEIAAHDEVSVSHVVRDALRTALPRLVELNRLLAHPEDRDRSHVLAVLGHLEQLEPLLFDVPGGVSGIDGVAIGDVTIPTRHKRRSSPPSSNTGANSTNLYPESGK